VSRGNDVEGANDGQIKMYSPAKRYIHGDHAVLNVPVLAILRL